MAKEIKSSALISRMKYLEELLKSDDMWEEASYEPVIVYKKLKKILLMGQV